MADNATATVDTVSPALQQQREDMQLPHDLMGGTQAMIRAGGRYIPREAGETPLEHQIRLGRTILLNVYKRTLRYSGGRVFEKPVVLGEDAADSRFAAFVENVDKQGRNLTVWSRRVFEEGLNDGVSFCVVDFSHVETRTGRNGETQYRRADGTWAVKTEAADRENAWAPYFVHVDAGQVLDARMQWRDGKPLVSHFRYIETLEEPDGPWGSKTYQQIRVFLYENDAAVWQTWRNSGNGNTDFVKGGEGKLSVGMIPVAVFMPGDKRTDMTAQPALIDLAQLNKRHWQATSSQFELMEFVRRPPWFGRNLGEFDVPDQKDKITVGPGRLCHSDNPDADLRSVGVDPGSVAAGRQELQDLEANMALYGLQLLQPKTGVITATESLRDAEENNSTLKSWALQFQDFLENCMKFAGMWWGMEDGPSVKVNTDFANALDASLLLDMFRAQVISARTLLSLYKDMGIVPDDFNVDEEAAKIAAGLMTNAGPVGVGGLAQRLGIA